MSKKSEIPFGAQFSPNQIDLLQVLQIIHEFKESREDITAAIRDAFFTNHAGDQRWQLADNCVLALRAYELLEEDGATPSEFASGLLKLISNPDEIYEHVAKHILVNLRGVTFVETLLIMQSAGEEITLHTLRNKLEQRGLHVPRGSVHLSSMRLWLAQAGIFDSSVSGGPRLYEVNQSRLNQLLGINIDVIDELTQLSASQRAYLRALVRIPDSDPLIANKVADLATMLYAAQYNHKELPKSILFPLSELAYIEVSKTTEGRGGKPYEVYRTEKFYREITEPILTAASERSGLVPRELFEKPLSQILEEMESTDKHIKGKALELLAIYLTRLVDLEFKGWRTRSADTGGAEVDAIVEGARLIFSRWQIQAKNTSIVRLDDIAKEVGLALTFIYSNVVMVVTTGDFTRDAYAYTNHVMKTSNLNIILLNGTDLSRLSTDPTDIVKILNAKAERAMQVKERSDYFDSK
ncbi:MAG: restriction endonuclease [Anaerolineaceae bacterium]|nr:restriction endonuclease [Anaerolineaceae bacterium]